VVTGKRVARVVALIAACAGAVAASAAVSATPDPSQMVLRPADVPGATASGRATTASSGYLGGYERSFTLHRPYGQSRFLYIESTVDLAAAAGRAENDFAIVRTLLRTSKFRETLAKEIVKSVGSGFKRKDLTLGKLQTPRVGDEAVELPMTMSLKTPVLGSRVPMRAYATVTFFRIDRAVEVLATVGARPVVSGDVVKLASLAAAHAGEQFMPVADAPPTVAGAAQRGQTLTAASGVWSNTPTLVFQWQRCDAMGASCADVHGATTATYVVAESDAGATLRVVEKGTNRFGTASAQSVQTAVVS
jgi:hypothetical protein